MVVALPRYGLHDGLHTSFGFAARWGGVPRASSTPHLPKLAPRELDGAPGGLAIITKLGGNDNATQSRRTRLHSRRDQPSTNAFFRSFISEECRWTELRAKRASKCIKRQRQSHQQSAIAPSLTPLRRAHGHGGATRQRTPLHGHQAAWLGRRRGPQRHQLLGVPLIEL